MKKRSLPEVVSRVCVILAIRTSILRYGPGTTSCASTGFPASVVVEVPCRSTHVLPEGSLASAFPASLGDA